MRNFQVFRLTLILLSFAVLPAFAQAAGFGSNTPSANNVNPLTARARFQPSFVEAGGTAEIIIELDLAKGFHAYSDRFKLVIESPDDLKLDQYKVAPVVPFKDAVSKSLKDGVEGRAILRATVEVPLGTKAEKLEAQLKLTYQACTSEFCLFPKSVSLSAPIEIHGGVKPAAVLPASATVATDDSGLKSALQGGLFTAFAFMFLIGFMTSLTPCIYPMIPITLAVLGVRAPRGGEKPSVWRSFSISVVYVLGLATTYSLLGVVAATTGGLFGAALANPYVVTVIALIFFAMGIGMYGLFEVQAPAFIRNRLGGASNTGGYPGAYMTGLVAGVIASPCIGPVLVSVLAYIAQTQNVTLGFSLLFSFALGMGVIFIVLGLFGNLLARLPRAGGWMDGVKYLFGTIMIGMAFYYIKPIYPAWLFVTLLGVAAFLLASFFGAFDPLETPVTHTARLRKGLMLAVFFIGVLITAGGLLSKLNLIPAAQVATVKTESLPWKPYTEAAFGDALKSGKPVLIDFMAEWCGACTELEELTYPKLIPQMNEFILFKVDATTSTPEIDAVTNKFGVSGLPTLLFFDKQGQALKSLTLTGFEDAEAFGKRLSQANR